MTDRHVPGQRGTHRGRTTPRPAAAARRGLAPAPREPGLPAGRLTQLDDLGDDVAVTPASERGPLPLVIPAAHGIRRVVVEDVAAGEILAAGLIEADDHVTEALTHRRAPGRLPRRTPTARCRLARCS